MPFPVESKLIVATEEKLGVKFPASFHQGMCEMNGGEVDTGTDMWRLFPIFDTSDKKRLKRTANDIVRETASAKEWSGFPTVAIAIGSNGSGNLLLMLPDEDDETKLKDVVFSWNHETGDIRVASPTVEILMNSRS
jgi:hypothetical protein